MIEKTLSLEKYKQWTVGPTGFMGRTLLALQNQSSFQKCLLTKLCSCVILTFLNLKHLQFSQKEWSFGLKSLSRRSQQSQRSNRNRQVPGSLNCIYFLAIARIVEIKWKPACFSRCTKIPKRFRIFGSENFRIPFSTKNSVTWGVKWKKLNFRKSWGIYWISFENCTCIERSSRNV